MRAVAVILIIALSLGVAIGLDFLITKTEENIYPLEYTEFVGMYAKEYNIPEYVILAVIKVESDFDPNATSRVGAMGLMQMMPDTFLWLTGGEHLKEYLPAASLYSPDVSIRYGTYYLLYLYRKFDYNWNTALAAYNGGEGNVAKWLSSPDYSDGEGNLTYIPVKETRNYVKKVNTAIESYKKLYYNPNEGVMT